MKKFRKVNSTKRNKKNKSNNKTKSKNQKGGKMRGINQQLFTWAASTSRRWVGTSVVLGKLRVSAEVNGAWGKLKFSLVSHFFSWES